MPRVPKKQMQFSFTYVAAAMAVLFLLQGLLMRPRPVAQTYSRFHELLDQGQIAEALIGADRIQLMAKPDSKLTDDEEKALKENQPLPARWAGSKPERLFEVTRIPGVDDKTLLEELIRKDVVFAGRIENTFWRDVLIGWVLPIGVMMLIWGFASRRLMQGGLGQALTLGKNRARIYSSHSLPWPSTTSTNPCGARAPTFSLTPARAGAASRSKARKSERDHMATPARSSIRNLQAKPVIMKRYVSQMAEFSAYGTKPTYCMSAVTSAFKGKDGAIGRRACG